MAASWSSSSSDDSDRLSAPHDEQSRIALQFDFVEFSFVNSLLATVGAIRDLNYSLFLLVAVPPTPSESMVEECRFLMRRENKGGFGIL
jgi:hypothetical protein